MSKKQSDSYIDLDDLGGKEKTFKLNGKEFEIKKDLPVKKLMELAELRGKGLEGDSKSSLKAFDKLSGLLTDICPEVEDELEKIGLKQMNALVEFVMETAVGKKKLEKAMERESKPKEKSKSASK